MDEEKTVSLGTIRHRVEMAELSRKLPNMDTLVTNPAIADKFKANVLSLRDMIIVLNDCYHWSRERIADWLQDLHDDGTLDLSFAGRSQDTDCQSNEEKN